MLLPDHEFRKPENLATALELLSDASAGVKLLAGLKPNYEADNFSVSGLMESVRDLLENGTVARHPSGQRVTDTPEEICA